MDKTLTERLLAVEDDNCCHGSYCMKFGIIAEAADELERLSAIVEKLPKTADGVPVVPGVDNVWQWHSDWGWTECAVELGGCVDEHLADAYGGSIKYCYSTREAALAAKKVEDA